MVSSNYSSQVYSNADQPNEYYTRCWTLLSDPWNVLGKFSDTRCIESIERKLKNLEIWEGSLDPGDLGVLRLEGFFVDFANFSVSEFGFWVRGLGNSRSQEFGKLGNLENISIRKLAV
ncbi:hypothetical protein K0M31_002459 [Melipona bicolor]|uniref:Uncharacterized protein n=1 Tax=Melipona bicolor TaxID=60889 RepID=A0AA40GHJ8_9HYME|nr:hypothetical protein K0M31_002459 [Melipona bicolor]